MRVYALYGKDGRIIALSEIVEDEKDGRVTAVLRGDLESKSEAVELTVPEGFEKRPFRELAAAFRVEVGSDGARFTAM
ncbi:hypothetical protein ACFVQ4_14415 [Streptomyces laurentii]|uniref:hypothetical protein n=1 Tax=Streptomyces laurentii TaxID=39478 RepID=UPI00369B4557